MKGYLALVLHAHLPYVRHPEHEQSLEENWLFEAITESYLPIFLVLDHLLEERVDFRLTFSLSPTLASMLASPSLQARYLKRLDRTIELAEKEVARTASLPEFQPLARMYRTLFEQVCDAYVHRYGKDLVGALRRFQESGKVEVIASAATHGYLPLLSVNESAVRAQIRVGVEHYRQTFGRLPQGFWLPECGYYPGADRLLSEEGIRYTILETHGITRADRRPRYGVYAPVVCPSGAVAFGRDPDSARQVWSSVMGYPGDYDYREFYRDIGHDLNLDYIGPYIHPDGIRLDTGIKYYRITGKGDHKEPYVPEWAERKAAEHAAHFLGERIKQVESLSASMDRKPVIVAPYDAELFGHWWFEGPRWLDYLIRKIAFDQDTVRLATLSEYLAEYPENQVATPPLSSWGQNGFHEVWLNAENDWIYRHLHQGADLMEELIADYPCPRGVTRRALNQAARELLLAQGSDWAFMIRQGTMRAYAAQRTKSHLHRLHGLAQQIRGGHIKSAWVRTLERRDDVFLEIETAAAFLPGARDVPAGRQRSVVEEAPARLRIVMLSSEVAPFAKTGGLADVVAALSAALRTLGHDVSVIMPAYREAFQHRLRDTGVRLAGEGRLLMAAAPSGVPVYFIAAERYFDRPFLYGDERGDYTDNAERFVFFCRSALDALRHLGAPHVLHAHDWQAALAITFSKAQPEHYAALSSMRSVMTIHNLGYQGVFPAGQWHLVGLDGHLFTPRHLEFHGQINFLKAGLVFADAITTVSPTYSREIQVVEHGFGLDGLLRERSDRMVGILNGADYGIWNPQTDRLIIRNYSADDLSGKWHCKAFLRAAFGLPDAHGPLMAIIARLAPQKGLDLVASVLDQILERRLQLIVLGAGDRKYVEFWQRAAERHARYIGIRIGFDESLAHQIEAGADLFLMPSRYEPCGLNQLYSMKYGTIPIVRATGGLKDSVTEFDPAAGRGTGFVFEAYQGSALLAAVDRALVTFRRKDQWSILMKNAMAADFSWDRSGREYQELYRSLMTDGRSHDSMRDRSRATPPS